MLIPIALCLLLVALFYFKYVRKSEDITRFPGPPTLPILGNILDLGFTKSKILNNLLRLSKQYGPAYRLWLGPKLYLVVTGPKYIEKILVTKSVTNKGAFYKLSKDWLGESTPVASGEKWHTARKFIAPFFNSINVDKLVPVFNANANKLIENLRTLDLNKPVEVESHIMSCALGNICQTVLNRNCDEQSKVQFWLNFRTLADIFIGRVFSIFARFEVFFRLTRNYQIQKQCIQKGTDIISNFVAVRKEERENDDDGADTPKLFLDFLLDRCKSDDQFTTKQVYQEMNAVLSAGSETVTASLAFCIYELSRHPDVQRKVWEEVEDVLGDDDLQADISLEHLHKLSYLQCVLKEILRVYTPVPIIERTLTEDITLEGELRIPKGTAVFLFLLGTHRSESVYSDPDKFNPDRFLSGNRLDTNQCTFVSFSAGARNCLGQRYSMMESKIMVSKIVRNFEIIAVDDHKPMLEYELVLRCSNGLPVILKQRSRN